MKNSFVELISLGTVSTVVAISAITFAITKPMVSFLLAIVGMIFGIFSLRIPKQEKLEKWSSWFGIILSITSMIWCLSNILKQ